MEDKEKFGKLTLTGRTTLKQFKGQRKTVYEATCECGKTKYFQKGNLTRGKTRSCGCEAGVKLKLLLFKGQYLTCKQVAKEIGLKNVSGVYSRIHSNIPLTNKYRQREGKLIENSMAGLGRKVGRSRERIRQLKERGLTDKEIIKRYE